MKLLRRLCGPDKRARRATCGPRAQVSLSLLPWYSPLCHQHIGSCCTLPPSGCCGETGARRGGSSSPHLRLQRDGQIDLLGARRGGQRPSDSSLSRGVFTLLASGSCPPEGTDAAEAVDLVHAGGPVGTGGRLALIYICKRNTGITSKSKPMNTYTSRKDSSHPFNLKQPNDCLFVSSLSSILNCVVPVLLSGGSAFVPQHPHELSPSLCPEAPTGAQHG